MTEIMRENGDIVNDSTMISWFQNVAIQVRISKIERCSALSGNQIWM